MQVNLSFDTDKDSVGDFRKLRDYIEKIIADKDGVAAKGGPVAKKEERVAERMTRGGCRVVPYQDLSDDLFALCSKRR